MPAVPAWVENRGADYARGFLETQDSRRRARIADMLSRVPPMIEADGAEAVRTWAESVVDMDPRALLIAEDSGDPRAPLPAQSGAARP